MPEINNTEENNSKKYAPLLVLFYTVISCVQIFSSVGGIFQSSLSVSLATGIICPFLTMLLYYLYLHSLGKDANKGALLIIIPTLFCIFSGYWFADYLSALYALTGYLSTTLAAAVIYLVSVKSKQRSAACATASFLMLVFSVLETVIPLFAMSITRNISIDTLLFDSISSFISEVIMQYNATLSSAASMFAAPDFQLSAQDAEYLENVLVSTIAISPAILCAAYYFAIYVFTRIADRVSVRLGITNEPVFGKYEISGVTNTVFNIAAVIIMFSILFANSMSPFIYGVLSVLIVILPGYLILGIRRIYNKLARLMSRSFSILIVAAIIFGGFMISYYLLILIIAFFGTSEYRACKSSTVQKYQ